MRENSLRRIAKIFDKSPDYFFVMKNQNKERFEFIASFDKDNFRKSVYKYQGYVADLFFEAQVIYSDLQEEKLDNILLELGYNNKSNYQSTRKQAFESQIHRLVIDDEALSVYFRTVKKIQQFIKYQRNKMNSQDNISTQVGQKFMDILKRKRIHPVLDIKYISTLIDDFVDKKMLTAQEGCFLLRFVIQNSHPK